MNPLALLSLFLFFCATQAKAASGCGPSCVNVLSLGGRGDGLSHPITAEELRSRGWAIKYRAGDEWDTIALQEAIDSAGPSETVFIPKGSYLIFRLGANQTNRGFQLKSGLRVLSDGAELRAPQGKSFDYAFNAQGSSTLQNILVKGIVFDGITFKLNSLAAPYLMSNITFERCAFLNGSGQGGDNGYQIIANYVSGLVIESCRFERDSRRIGRSVIVQISRRVRIANSSWSGHFITAINVGGVSETGSAVFDDGRSTDIEIDHNKLYRAPGSYAEDHGIYAWGMRRLSVTSNEIAGWSLSAAGGGIKVRNGEDIAVRFNRLHGSGILLYAYYNSRLTFPNYLRNVAVEHNDIDLSGAAASTDGNSNFATYRPGISYWKNFAGDDKSESIAIRYNEIKSGSITVFQPAHGPGFQITHNRVSYLALFPSGISAGFNDTLTPERNRISP
jgi:hypothetical protein